MSDLTTPSVADAVPSRLNEALPMTPLSSHRQVKLLHVKHPKPFVSPASRWRDRAQLLSVVTWIVLPLVSLLLLVAIIRLIKESRAAEVARAPQLSTRTAEIGGMAGGGGGARPDLIAVLASRSLRPPPPPPPPVIAQKVVAVAPREPKMELVATMVSKRAAPRAYLRPAATQKLTLVHIGDQIDGFKVTAISEGQVTVELDGVEHQLGVARK